MTAAEKKVIGYYKIHAVLLKTYGKAGKCENDDCKSTHPKRFEWALIKGRQYSIDIKDYIQLCPSCHRKYDMTEETRKIHSINMREGLASGKLKNPNNSKGKFRGAHQTAKRIAKVDISTGVILAKYECVKDVIEDGYRPDTISMCLNGRNKTSGGFFWEYLK